MSWACATCLMVALRRAHGALGQVAPIADLPFVMGSTNTASAGRTTIQVTYQVRAAW